MMKIKLMGSKLIPKHYRHFTPEEFKAAILPHLEVEKIIGYLRTGLKYKLYKMLLKTDCLFVPMRLRVSFIKYYYSFIESLLKAIEITTSGDGARLIAVCRPSKSAITVSLGVK